MHCRFVLLFVSATSILVLFTFKQKGFLSTHTKTLHMFTIQKAFKHSTYECLVHRFKECMSVLLMCLVVIVSSRVLCILNKCEIAIYIFTYVNMRQAHTRKMYIRLLTEREMNTKCINVINRGLENIL